MIDQNLASRVQSSVSRYNSKWATYQNNAIRIESLAENLRDIQSEQALIEQSKDVMDGVKKYITKTSLEYCEKLATSAIQSIFGFDAEVKYVSDDGKFYLEFKDGMRSDIAGDEGGGVKTVISFVFSLYLVIKSKSRRIMFFDEQFSQISSEYLPSFVAFVKQICRELQFDICLITHDDRFLSEYADLIYSISSGVSHRVK